ncbi:NmrA family NAD(P)-binding protein [Flagellimonas olearia]|uniref:NAD-dependent dehydratase n=1 Tax=Flagellimonas olearia TaxID=552546 RepID=A0A444VJR9_9FLAO|nr:NmrA family NAD(P)-binding protein [Allomuricauda olearia]RYC51017.1 NAD-dependent dehydratase [Allomuricauda olearia]
MKIVLTGSLGHISKPLALSLLAKGHHVTIISSRPERRVAIEALNPNHFGNQVVPAIGRLQDVAFLTETFKGADIVYVMEAINANTGAYFNPSIDIDAEHFKLADNFTLAIKNTGVSKVVHLSTIGAHTGYGVGLLNAHYYVEETLNALPESVRIKFMRPVGFYNNMYSFIDTIREEAAIFQNYGGDQKEPWVSPLDIAEVISEEMELPFVGRSVRYIASDEVSPNEVAQILGAAIGKPELEWIKVSDEQFIYDLLYLGMNPNVAMGLTEMNTSRVNGILYEDYYKNKPELGKVKLEDFAEEFAKVYYQKLVI